MNHTLTLTRLPVAGPISRDAFFALTSPVPGLPPTKRLAIGTASFFAAKTDDELRTGVNTLHHAWRDGFLLTDTSTKYGEAEVITGKALAAWDGLAPIINTKTVSADYDKDACRRDVLEKYFARSIQRLGRTPDMLAVHEPHTWDVEQIPIAVDFIRELLATGRIKGAGLGGGGPLRMRQFAESGTFHYALTHNRLSAITLQGLRDAVPMIKSHGMKVFAAAPLMYGTLGRRYQEMQERPHKSMPAAIFTAARQLKELADDVKTPMTQLAMRFALSLPSVDYVLSGAGSPHEWADVVQAYEAGPLDADLYQRIWRLAHDVPAATDMG